MLAEEIGISWDKTIQNQIHTNFDLLFPDVAAIDYDVEVSDRLKLKFIEHKDEITSNIQNVKDKGTEVTLDNVAIIKHYDPMNMNYYKEMIYSENFVKLKIGQEFKTLEGTTILHLVPGSFDEVQSYTTIQ